MCLYCGLFGPPFNKNAHSHTPYLSRKNLSAFPLQTNGQARRDIDRNKGRKTDGMTHGLCRPTDCWQADRHISCVSAQLMMLFCSVILHGHAITRVGNGYDQAQLRSIKMADAEHGEFRLSRIVSTWHLVRHPYCARRESWDRLIFWVWVTAAAGWDIADIGKRKFRRIDRNCHGLLIVTAFQSRRLLIVTCLNES